MIPAIIRLLKTASIKSPIKSPVIEDKVGLSGHMLRKTVSRMRAADYEIGSYKDGYWWAETPEEVERAIAWLDAKLGPMMAARDGLKRRRLQMIAKIRRADERIRVNGSVRQGPEEVPTSEQTKFPFLV